MFYNEVMNVEILAMQVLHNSTTTALWHDIIREAETQCNIQLKEELQSYLVFLMMRYTSRPDIANHVVAIDFLSGLGYKLSQKQQALQEVGDKCLIYSGLFPKRAQKRLVQLSYFVNLGQSSYANVSRIHNDLYARLAMQFVSLMDVLQALRVYSGKYPDLLPLEAYDLWNETGSQRALNVLKKYTSSMDVIQRFSQV